MRDGPFQTILKVCEHVFEGFGPLRVTVELKPDGHVGHLVLIYGIRHLKIVVLRYNPVCKLLHNTKLTLNETMCQWALLPWTYWCQSRG